MYVFGKFHYSRYIVLGTILGIVVLEVFIFVGLYYAFRFHKENKTFASTGLYTRSSEMENLQSPKFYLEEPKEIPVISNEAYIPPFSKAIPEDSIIVPIFQTYLKDYHSLLDFVNDYVDLSRFSLAKTLVLNSETFFNIENEAEASRQ